ncbi:S41 family peptidase [Streptomyces sp. NRRL F-5630]|uniref:S41 family peptidase n=1 Tax=Streptomyces sp. NRRL F-5630 TaxID=1463864 RepID=UPI003D752797
MGEVTAHPRDPYPRGGAAYLRHPALHADLLCFVAEDDLWLAPLPAPGATEPSLARRLTADRTKLSHPRFSPDGAHLAFISWRSLDPEIHLAEVAGDTPVRQLTYWAGRDTRVCGWSPPDADGRSDILAVSSQAQPFSYFSWAYKVPTDGSPGGRLPWGPVSALAQRGHDGDERTLLLTGTPPHEPAAWKRYRGGATGRLWLHGERLLPDLEGHLDCPLFVGDRVAFLSDHEGVGNVYSCRPDGSDLRRHTDHDAFYARNAASDGHRIVYQCAGELWLVDDLAPDALPRRLDIRLGGARSGRRHHQVPAARHLDAVCPDETGRASAVAVRGSLYWLTHRDGPARTLADTPGVRVRMPVLYGGGGSVAYVSDAGGADGIEVAPLPRAGTPGPVRRWAHGRLGLVEELVASPQGDRFAVATHDGRLLLVDPPAGESGAPGEGAPAEEAPAGVRDEAEARDGGGAESRDGGGGRSGAEGEAARGDGSGPIPAGAPTTPGAEGSGAGAAGDTRAAEAAGTTGATGADRASGTATAGAAGPVGATGATGAAGATGATGATGAFGTAASAETTESAESAPGHEDPSAPEPPDPSGPTKPPEARVIEVVRSFNGPVRDLAFSPDGAWLAWSHPGVGRSLRQIKLARISEGEGPFSLIDVTDGRFEDENPVFTRDGRYLAFLSWRGFDPVYDVHTGDLSFPLGCRPHLVTLSSATPSPFALSADGRPAAGGLDPDDRASGYEGLVIVEAEGLASRVTPFPVPASKYSSLCPVAGGGLVWLRWPISGALGQTFVNPADTSSRPTLEHFDPARARRTQLVDHMDAFAVSGDGSRLVVVDDGELRAIPANDLPDDSGTSYIDLRRILHEVDPPAEWRQAYDEAGRVIRAYFWDPGLSNIDWDAVLDQYRPLLDRVASPDEFADLLREAYGELGTSHAYVTAARRSEGPPHYQRAQGLLGADFTCRDGAWELRRILPGESSDPRARSPLAGTGIREGAVLTHVDGRPVDPVAGPAPLLAGAAGTSVELTFAAAGGGPPRRVAVLPLVDERALRYHDWVAKRRAVVRELSDGKCGYLHIPDLGGSGWAQFNRDLRLEMSMPALIVDVRGNAGGNISELVLEKLTRRIIGWDLTRDAMPVSYASNAPRGPLVALADEATSSDGDMITAAFKLLGLGPVVGQRTWGGVVGMTGRHRLIDGTVVTVPMNAAWFDAYDWGVENHGVDPDVPALRTPLDWAEGRHAQLDDAVSLALDLLRSHPPAEPPTVATVPDRARPPLPGRGESARRGGRAAEGREAEGREAEGRGASAEATAQTAGTRGASTEAGG